MNVTPEQRAEVVAGLREALDFLEAHPELPVYRHWTLTAHTATDDDEAGRAEVDAAARVLEVQPTGTTHYRATRPFGSVAYEVLHIELAHMADYRARMSRLSEIEAAESSAEQQGEGETP